MKNFHFQRGVRRRTRVSFVLVALLLFAEVAALQHYMVQNLQVSAASIDTPYLEKLQALRETEHTASASLVFMGDVMLARGIGAAIESGQDPFEEVSTILAEHDVRIANIETTVADPSYASAAAKPYTFNAPLSSLKTLKNVGIDVSSLANNHTGDFGRAATANTIDQFELAGLKTVGAGKNIESAFAPRIVEINDIKVAFIAVNDIELAHTMVSPTAPGSAYLDKERIQRSIQDAREGGADTVVILPHWGIEYSLTESNRQREWGRFMIDAGADLVIGGHPHVVQPTEQYNGGQIVYSLGNFIFDGMSGDALKGQMISVNVTKIIERKDTVNETTNTSISTVKSIPVTINELGFPKPV